LSVDYRSRGEVLRFASVNTKPKAALQMTHFIEQKEILVLNLIITNSSLQLISAEQWHLLDSKLVRRMKHLLFQ